MAEEGGHPAFFGGEVKREKEGGGRLRKKKLSSWLRINTLLTFPCSAKRALLAFRSFACAS